LFAVCNVQSAEPGVSQYYECLVVGTLNLAALLLHALTHLLESSLSACGAGAAPGPAAASVDQQHHALASAPAMRQLAGDPKLHALLARYANCCSHVTRTAARTRYEYCSGSSQNSSALDIRMPLLCESRLSQNNQDAGASGIEI